MLVPVEHQGFRALKMSRAHIGARALMNRVGHTMGDPDGNFIKDFQSTGFHARVFELACYAYLAEGGIAIDRSFERPDFLASKSGVRFALEAVTANPRSGSPTDVSLQQLRDLPLTEILSKCGDEFPIRVGSPLTSKVRKAYWKLPQCEGLPLVLVIGPFHEAGSQMYVDESLARYLYGAWIASAIETEHCSVLVHETPIFDAHL